MELWHHIIIVVSCTNASELIWNITNRSYSTCLENGEFLTLLQNTHQCKQWSFMSMISFLFHLFSRRAYCSGAVYQTWKKSDAIDEIQRPTVAIPDLSYVNNLRDDKTIWSVIIDHFIHSFIWRVRYPVFCPLGATDVHAVANRLPLPRKISDNDGNSTIRNST